MAKENWKNLSKEERRRYMQLQMSPQGGYNRSGYLPLIAESAELAVNLCLVAGGVMPATANGKH